MARRISSKPDYALRCTVRAESFEATDVPCRIYLPEGKDHVPVIHLVPNERHYASLTRAHELSLTETLDRLSVESHVLYFIHATQRGFDPDHVDAFLVECEARDLRISECYSDKEAGDRPHVVFRLTPNPWLSPGKIRTSNPDGSVEMSHGELPTASLPSGITVTFDTHYESRSENEEFIQRPHLVAEVDVAISAGDTDRLAREVLSDLDDLLLLVSLGSRTRTICVGWTAADNASITRYFRGDRVVPTRTPTDSWYGLVPQRHRSEFLQAAYAQFLAFSDRDATRRAIYASVPFHNSVFSETYLSRFAGIESCYWISDADPTWAKCCHHRDGRRSEKLYLISCDKATPFPRTRFGGSKRRPIRILAGLRSRRGGWASKAQASARTRRGVAGGGVRSCRHLRVPPARHDGP